MLVTLLLQRQELIDNRNEFKRTADANERMAANGLKQIQVQWLLEKKKQILKIMEAREAEFAAFDDEEHAEMIKNLYLSELEKIDQEYTRITS